MRTGGPLLYFREAGVQAFVHVRLPHIIGQSLIEIELAFTVACSFLTTPSGFHGRATVSDIAGPTVP